MAIETFIRWYDDALPLDFCCDVVERFEADPNQRPGRVASKKGNIEVGWKKQTTEVFLDVAEWRDVEQTLTESVAKTFEVYRDDINLFEYCAYKDVDGEGFRIKRYRPGEQFTWHVDSPTKETFTRVLAAQWYFNDVAEGGATEFRHQDISVLARAGRIVIFPVSWMYHHRGAPPLSGPKYICTTFLHPAFEV